MRFRLLFSSAVPATALLLTAQAVPAQAGAVSRLAGAAVQVSADPYTNATAEHASEVEPDTIAVGHSVMSVFQVGRWDNGCSDDIGWAFSTNSGQTWAHGELPALTTSSTPPGPFVRVSDPAVAYDAAFGEWVVSGLDCNGTSPAPNAPVTSPSVSVSLSSDGVHWSKPVIVATVKKGQDYDKDWVTCDNTPTSRFYGNCYVEWDLDSNGDLVVMSTSRDGGFTWSSPATTATRLHGIGGEPIVLPNGTVVVPINGFVGRTSPLVAFRSTDGGRTWGTAKQVTGLFQQGFPGNLRGPSFFDDGIDGAGRIYMVWPDCRFRPACAENDMVMTTSADGVHWTPVVRIPVAPLSSGLDDVGGGLGVDALTSGTHARLGLYYYFFKDANCTVATCQLSVGFVSSTDGGGHWSTPRTVAGPMTMRELPDAFGFMVGDYQGAAVVPGGHAFAAFSAGGIPAGNAQLNDAMYDASGGEPVTGGTVPATSAGALKPAPTSLPKIVK